MSTRPIKFGLSLWLTLALAGCATLNEQPSPLNQTQSWQERSAALSQLQSWDVSAVMAIRTANPSEGGSANLQWQQYSQNNYHLTLYGPLGSNTVNISGQQGLVTLETAEGKKFTAATPELLLAQQTGWQLPVSDLYYWIRGLPVKGVSSNMQFDASHHLLHLQQSGWTIDYLRYSAVNQFDLPAKLMLENTRLKIKIIINQWKI